MNQEEFKQLSEVGTDEQVITADNLTGSSRILIYGYDVDRNTFSVYYNNILNEVTIIVGPHKFHQDEIVYNEQYVPNKRVYPDRCDFQFCKLLIEREVRIPFLGHYDWPETSWEVNASLKNLHSNEREYKQHG